jgi:hypothetical protein
MSRLWKPIIMAALAVMLAGCAGNQAVYENLPALEAGGATFAAPVSPIQCVPYARAHSSVKIYGDAWTWWDQAAGKFSREPMPRTGAVIVLAGYDGPKSGHVAVVRALDSPREIRVDHANWLDDGKIDLNDPVADISSANDWSEVRVWNVKTGSWGSRIYPVEGFIGPAPDNLKDLIARADLDDGH